MICAAEKSAEFKLLKDDAVVLCFICELFPDALTTVSGFFYNKSLHCSRGMAYSGHFLIYTVAQYFIRQTV